MYKRQVVNLGCRVNRVESDRITADLMRLGFAIVEPQDADLIVINTCLLYTSIDAVKEAGGVFACTIEHGDITVTPTENGFAMRCQRP